MTDNQESELKEVWALFAQESRENIAAAETGLLQLEQDPHNGEQVKVLFRALHSFKGGARMMGLARVETVAHRAEDLMAMVRDEGVALKTEMVTQLFATLDCFRAMLDEVEAKGGDVAPNAGQDAIEALSRLIEEAKSQLAAGNTSPADAAASSADTAASSANSAASSASAAAGGAVQLEPAPAPNEPQSDWMQTTGQETTASPSPANLADENLLRLSGELLSKLQSALEELAAGKPDTLIQIAPLAQELRDAAKECGYLRLAEPLETLLAEIGAEAPAGQTQARLAHLKKLELAVFEELMLIQESAQKAVPGWSDIAYLFRNWNAERVFADLAQVSAIADQLSVLKEGDPETRVQAGADQVVAHLRSIYHGCLFYHLDGAANLVLALEDLYARVAQRELAFTPKLAEMTRACTTHVGEVIDAVEEGNEISDGELVSLVKQVENFIFLETGEPGQPLTPNILDVIDLPVTFKEAMTPEALTQFQLALEAEEQFYTVLADLEQENQLVTDFLEWIQSDQVRRITNVTVHRYNRSLFNFLFATALSREQLLESLIRMDPQWKYLSLQPYPLKHAEAAPANPAAIGSAAAGEVALSGLETALSNDKMEELSEQVGTLVASHTSLHRIIDRLVGSGFVDSVQRWLDSSTGEERITQTELRESLRAWTGELNGLELADAGMAGALGHLQETTRAMQRLPAARLLDPVKVIAGELAHQSGKPVELDFRGGELDIDCRAAQALSEPLSRLIRLLIGKSLEDGASRRRANKPAAAVLALNLTEDEDHIGVIVEDDGRGIDPDDAEFAQIKELLNAQHGTCEFSRATNRGTRIDLRLPIERTAVDGMIVRAGGVRYVIPVSAIRRIVRTDAASLIHSSAEGSHFMLRLDNSLVPVRTLAGDGHMQSADQLIVVIEGEPLIGLKIDELIGQQQVVVRPLAGALTRVEGASGCALLGEGEVGIVLSRELIGHMQA